MAKLSMTYVIMISVCLQLGVSMRKLMQSILMNYRLRDLANPSRSLLYPIVHIDGNTLSQSLTEFSKYLKSQFILSYSFHCNTTATHVNIHDRDVKLVFVI